jgi:hypothetical protein
MRRIASDTAAMAKYTNLIDEFENLQSTYNAMRKNYTIQLLALKVWYGKAAKELQQGNSAQDVTAVGREWEAHRKEFDLLLEVDRDLMQRLTDWEKQYNTMLADFAKKYS